MLAHVPSLGRNPRGSPDLLAYLVPTACMHVLGTGVPRCLGVPRSASSPKAAQALGCSLTPGLRITFGRVTCMALAASVPGPLTPGFLLLCCACVSVCSGPLLARVMGCVCVCVRDPLVPRLSWLGCAVWVCVLGLGFRLRPATPGWVVGACVCLCASSACTPPLLAWVCGVGLCAWARVSAAHRHSWLGCSGLCVLVWPLRLCPVTPGWGVRCRCVCLGSGFVCAPPLLAGLLGPVCVCVRVPLVPRHSRLGCAVWVCVLGLGFRLRPATPGRGVGVCVCLCACSAVPHHSWVGCALWVCVLGLGFWLRPGTAGRGVGVCVWLCERSACTPPLLAGVCGVGVCATAPSLAAPRHSWLGCWGVCVWLCAHSACTGHATRGSVVRCGCVCWG